VRGITRHTKATGTDTNAELLFQSPPWRFPCLVRAGRMKFLRVFCCWRRCFRLRTNFAQEGPRKIDQFRPKGPPKINHKLGDSRGIQGHGPKANKQKKTHAITPPPPPSAKKATLYKQTKQKSAGHCLTGYLLAVNGFRPCTYFGFLILGPGTRQGQGKQRPKNNNQKALS